MVVFTVSVELLPGVTLVAEKLVLMLLSCELAVKLTAFVKPSMPCTLIMKLVDAPACTVFDAGVIESEKSGTICSTGMAFTIRLEVAV